MRYSALVLIITTLFITSYANAEYLNFQKSVFRGQGSFNTDYNEPLPTSCEYDEIYTCPEGFTLSNGKCYSNYFKSIVIFKYKCSSDSVEVVEYDEYETHTYSTTNQQDIISVAEQLAQNTRTSYCPEGTLYLGSVYMYQLEAASLSDNQFTAIENVISRAYCRINGTGQGGGTSGNQGTDDYSITAIKSLIIEKLNSLKDRIMSNIKYKDVSVDDVSSITLYGRTITIDINEVPYLSTIVNGIYYMIVLTLAISLIRM